MLFLNARRASEACEGPGQGLAVFLGDRSPWNWRTHFRPQILPQREKANLQGQQTGGRNSHPLKTRSPTEESRDPDQGQPGLLGKWQALCSHFAGPASPEKLPGLGKGLRGWVFRLCSGAAESHVKLTLFPWAAGPARGTCFSSRGVDWGPDAVAGGAVVTFFSPLQILTRLTERFVLGVDLFLEAVWKVWTELLDVLGLDVSNLLQYLSPASVSSSPARALLLVGVVLVAYWFLSLTLGFTFGVLHLVFGRFFWLVRVVLFSMSCMYILHKYEGEPERAVLPLCLVVAIYFMTGPMGFYWRSSSPGTTGGPSVEEKLEHLENQLRLLNIRLNRVLETFDRPKDK
ncbi:BRI3-binding protein [Heterocephalus glaber]|uniref:BRI3-binding protein n=1 Tax=Heterocephalus glaber TaxID=10181 RepID=G5AWU8_HETGA|nr:BRI3-binding protein [Heterocephalus glaber]